MNRKLTLMILSLLLVGSLVSGCGKKSNSQDQADANESADGSGYGSLTDGNITYIGDIEDEIYTETFIVNVATATDNEDERFIGQMMVTLEEGNDFRPLMTPGNTVVITLENDERVTAIKQATDDDKKKLQEYRSLVGQFESDIEYIKSISGEEVLNYANGVYATWTDDQINEYRKVLDELMQNEEFKASYEAYQVNVDSVVMTASERAEDYKKNPQKYGMSVEYTKTDENGEELEVITEEQEAVGTTDDGMEIYESVLDEEQQALYEQQLEENRRINEEMGFTYDEDGNLLDAEGNIIEVIEPSELPPVDENVDVTE